MNEPQRFRSIPTEIDAIQWTGTNEQAVQRFARDCFFALNRDERMIADDPAVTAQVYDRLHSTWILVYTDQWIIKGTKGEFYPCDDDVFAAKYQYAEGC